MSEGGSSKREMDSELQARLDRLAGRRPAAAHEPATASSRRSPRRGHPAGRSRAAALGLSLATTGGLGLYFASGNVASATGDLEQSAQVSGIGPESTAATSTTSPPLNIAAPTTVNGAPYTNRWGQVQVQASFTPDGSIADVVVLESPSHNGTSVRINHQAVPMLNSEVLSAQSANVDTVSGATYTSHDYERSLQSAIDAARHAGLTRLA